MGSRLLISRVTARTRSVISQASGLRRALSTVPSAVGNKAPSGLLDVSAVRELQSKFAHRPADSSRDALAGLRPTDRLSVVLFDVATSGLDPASDRVVEIAARDVATGSEFSSLVDPGESRRQSEGSKVHGIAADQLAQAEPFAMIGTDFVRWCKSLRAAKVFLVAHMFQDFDDRFLRAEYARAGMALPPSWTVVNAMDVVGDALHRLEIASGERPLPSRDGYVPLVKLAAHLGTTPTPTHRADVDVDALLQVLKTALSKAYPAEDFASMLLFLSTVAAEKRAARVSNGARAPTT